MMGTGVYFIRADYSYICEKNIIARYICHSGPTLFHTYAFTGFLSVTCKNSICVIVCALFWITTNIYFEYIQLDVKNLFTLFGGGQGTFDVNDVYASIFGASLAAFTVIIIRHIADES